jgi:hypothetical protein
MGWWFTCTSAEMIARIGSDLDGSNVSTFIFNDDSSQQLQVTEARWNEAVERTPFRRRAIQPS